MPLTLNTGSPVPEDARIVAVSKKIATENPVEFASSATRTGNVQNREFPMKGILFELKVTIANQDAGATMHAMGPFNLIKSLKVAVDGTDTRFSSPGKNLPIIHHIKNGSAYLHDVVVTANGDYSAFFYLPFDIGGYRSLLDVSRNTSLDIQVDWGQLSDLVASGTSTIGSAELSYEIDYISGVASGPGSKGYPYLASFMHTATIDIDSTRPDQLIERLTAQRGYHGATVFSYDNDVRSDGIVNSITLERADSKHFKQEYKRIQARNRMSYELTGSDDWTGVLDMPIVDPGHMEHMQTVRHDQSMKVEADVTKTGNPCKVELLTHYFKQS